MQEGGINLFFGVQGLKVHAKMCVIEREEGKKVVRYGFISTGNFNESTAKVYTDYTLLTSNKSILKDLNKVFMFFEANYKIYKYKNIITSPHHTKKTIFKLINEQIKLVKEGNQGYIRLKMNSITSYLVVDKLYEASRAGVKIDMIVRGICCLIPGVKYMSENIKVISVVDKFLEHPRVYIFGKDDEAKVYISSADWMTRNIDNRVEVTCPIYDEGIKQEIIDSFDICWSDNVKARLINTPYENEYKIDDNPKVRSQVVTYDYYLKKLEK